MTKIPLTNSPLFALVDDEDSERVLKYRWNLQKDGRIRGHYCSESTSLSRFILWFPVNVVDHINGDQLDNRKENLRECSHSENIRNQKKQKGKSSKYKGVSWFKRVSKWIVHIKAEKKLIYLGYFEDEIEAAKVYDQAAIKYHKKFAKLNFPIDISDKT
jgi:hypothetical protein